MQVQIKSIQSRLLYPTALRFLMVVLLMLGIFFRFANLDRKVYWHDEAFTSMRVSGYLRKEILQEVFKGQVIGIRDLDKYQQPSLEKGLLGTIKGLAQEEPQHPPLYFVMMRIWAQLFGSSVAVTRTLSVFISLLVFPAIYWLCLELFESPLVGWMAIAIVAVSPIHVLFAQEAREYVLWTVTILLSSAALLRALRDKTKFNWGIYAVTLVVGLYTFLFTGLVAIGHGIYVVVTENFRRTKTVTIYLFATFVSFLTFVPWIIVVILSFSSFNGSTRWSAKDYGLLFLVKTWCLNLSRIFLDLDINTFFDVDFSFNKLITYLSLPILVLIGYSIYFLYRNSPKRVWLFVLTLIGSTALALLLPDLILGGRRSITVRYLFPCVLGIELAVAYLLITKMTSISVASVQQKLWQLVTLAIISIGVVSNVSIAGAEVTWNKSMSCYNPQLSRIINQANHPLLVSSSYGNNVAYLLSLSHLLNTKVQLQLVVEPDIPKIPSDFGEIFLFNPSKAWLAQFEKEQAYKIEPVYQPICRAYGDLFWGVELWRLEKKNI